MTEFARTIKPGWSIIDREHEKRKYMEWLKYDKYVELYTKEGTNIIPPLFEHTGWWHMDYKQCIKSLRDYQVAAIKDIMHHQSWNWLIVSGVWTGKSFMIAEVVQYWKTIWELTCVVVPKQTIAQWIKDKFDELGIQCKIVTNKECTLRPDCCYIMCAQTFNKCAERAMWCFRFLVLDEAHRLPKSRIDQINSWSYYGGNVIWFTWTPERKDMHVKDVYKFRWKVHETNQLALPVDVFVYEYEYNYNNEEAKIANEWLPPDSPELVNRLIMNNKDRDIHLLKIVNKLLQSHNKIIIFCNRVQHIDTLMSLLESNTISCLSIKGDTNKKKLQIALQSFKKWVIVANVASAWEGFDHPEISAWILYYPTQWTVSIQQAVWRMQRPYKGKTKAVFIDFADYYSIGSSKKKTMGIYWRKKIYAAMWWNVTVLSRKVTQWITKEK